MNAADDIDRLFDIGHVSRGTMFRTGAQQDRYEKSQLRKIVCFGMMRDMERVPSRRAAAFIRWMEANDLKTKRVAITSGVPQSTLASFVQGVSQSLKGDTEEKIASAYETTIDAIFAGATNSQSSRAPSQARIIGRVGADTSGSVIMATAHDRWDMVSLPPGTTTRSVALEVSGHSMNTFAPDGSLIFFEDQQTPPSADLLNAMCVVETDDGQVLVKRLKRGSAPGLYDLESDVGPVISDVRLRWAAEVIVVVLPRQAQRLTIRGAESAA